MNFLRNINTEKQKLFPSLPLWSLTSEVRNITGLLFSHALPESLLSQKDTKAVTSTHLGNIPFLNYPDWEGREMSLGYSEKQLEGGRRNVKAPVPSETGYDPKKGRNNQDPGEDPEHRGGRFQPTHGVS